MTHNDLIQTTKAEAALRCARLHLHGGKRRLQKGLTAPGMRAIYDSVLFGMRYYVARHKHCSSFLENIDLWDAGSLFHALSRAGVFDDPLSFNHFCLNVEQAMWKESFSSNHEAILAEAEKMLDRLGVISLHESTPVQKAGHTA